MQHSSDTECAGVAPTQLGAARVTGFEGLLRLLSTLHSAIAEVLTPHQRRVLVALALNGVPIHVLAERLATTRGAL
jgi:hypothetical protein